jgi:hypothetical protein
VTNPAEVTSKTRKQRRARAAAVPCSRRAKPERRPEKERRRAEVGVGPARAEEGGEGGEGGRGPRAEVLLARAREEGENGAKASK